MAKLRSRDPTPQPADRPSASRGNKTAASNAPAGGRGGRRAGSGRPKAHQATSVASTPSVPTPAVGGSSPLAESRNADPNVPMNQSSATKRSEQGPGRGRYHDKLPVVEEENNIFHVHPQEDGGVEEGRFQDAVESQNESRSSGGHSSFSGTTAVTTHSQKAIRRLSGKKRELFQQLPLLHDQSSMILRDLASDRITMDRLVECVDQLKGPSSAGSLVAKLQKRRSEFAESFEDFAGDDYFIRPELLMAALFQINDAAELPKGAWRPDDLLYKANLAELVYKLIVALPDADETSKYLLMLDGIFPRPFMSWVSEIADDPGASRLREQTFEAALALRTQYAITRLRMAAHDQDGTSTFEPDNILLEVFCAPESDWDNLVYREWEVEAFKANDGALIPQHQQAIRMHMQMLKRYTTPSGNSLEVDFDGLEKEFPWVTFQFRMATWAATRNRELTASITRDGGADQIISDLEHVDPSAISSVDNRDDAQQLAEELSQMNRTIGSGGQPFPTMEAPMYPRQRPTMEPPPGFRQASEANYSQVDPSLEESQGGIYQQPPKRLNDAQPNATRVDFDTHSSQFNQPGGELVDPVTQDGGFQQQESRPNDVQSRRKKTQPMKRRRTAPASSNNELLEGIQSQAPGEEGSEYHVSQDDHEHPRKRRRTAQVERLPSPDADAIAPSTNYFDVQQAAKRQGAMTQSASRPEPQKRTPWTPQEIEQLVWLVEIYGVSWALLKKKDETRGNILARRDQIALKDKARNMKADYLSQNMDLPQHFRHVALSKKEINRVKSRRPDWDERYE